MWNHRKRIQKTGFGKRIGLKEVISCSKAEIRKRNFLVEKKEHEKVSELALHNTKTLVPRMRTVKYVQ